MTKGKSLKKRKFNSPGNSQSAPNTSSQVAPAGQCEICHLDVEGESRPPTCNVCDSVFHGICIGFNEDTVDLLLSIVDVVGWVCDPCISTAKSAMKETNSTKAASVPIKKLQTELIELKTLCNNTLQEVILVKNSLNSSLLSTQPSTNLLIPSTASSTSQPQVNISRPTFASILTGTAKIAPSGIAHNRPVPTASAPVSSQDVLVLMEQNNRDKLKRSRNVIVSNVHPVDGVSDGSLLAELFERHLDLHRAPDISSSQIRRIGKVLPNKVRPILISMSTAEDAKLVLSNARNLRESIDPHIRNSVYINPDRNPIENQLAFEARARRRAYNAQHPSRDSSQPRDDPNPPSTSSSSVPGPSVVSNAAMDTTSADGGSTR